MTSLSPISFNLYQFKGLIFSQKCAILEQMTILPYTQFGYKVFNSPVIFDTKPAKINWFLVFSTLAVWTAIVFLSPIEIKIVMFILAVVFFK